MKELKTEELLFYIADSPNDKKKADESFTELYYRFSEFLTNAVWKHIKSRGIYDEDVAHDVIGNVFMKVYEDPLKFEYNSGSHSSEEDAYRVWLSIVARNEINDLIKKSVVENPLVSMGYQELVERYADFGVTQEELGKNASLIQKGLNNCTDMQRHILLTCYDYYENGKNTPSEVLRYLSAYWETTTVNIRQIKSRCIKKIKDLVGSKISLRVEK